MADEPASRDVTQEDLQAVDVAIDSHQGVLDHLYAVRFILGQVGKVDTKRADIIRGVESEQARLAEAHRQANAAQAELAEVQRQITEKRRELAEAEKTVKERELRAGELNDAINHLRAMLAAA
jgi:chromosome segregation ATPase